jgi:glycosyltransferase involved in cell wall biosynthesis
LRDAPAVLAPQSHARQSCSLACSPANVVFRAAIYDGSGYADEARGIIFGLYRAGFPVRVEPFGLQYDAQNLLNAEEQEILEALKHQRVDLARGIHFQHYPANDFNLAMRGRYRVGRTMYETDSIPDGWRDCCEGMDEVWVPGSFNCETFAAGGVSRERLRALPGGINTALFRPGAEPFPIPKRRGFNFLSVFEWIERKGADVLLRAYLTEFKPEEDVTLMLKTYDRPDANADMLPRLAYFVERQMGMRLQETPTILLLSPDFLPAAELPRLYASADAFVLPTRGEGWGRPYMEALACACPVIATRWSGQMEFLHDNICDLIDYTLVPVPWNNDVELSAGHRWAEPSVEHLRHLMRHVFEHREAAKQKVARGRAEMVAKWDWEHVIRERWVPEFDRLLNS